MRYAIIQNGIVTNIIVLYPGNTGDFPGAVKIDEGRPVAIGDSYADGVFARGGAPVLTADEATIAELDAALLDAEYNAIVGGDL